MKQNRNPYGTSRGRSSARAPAAATTAAGKVDLLGTSLADRKPVTLRAYREDLGDFAAFLGVPAAS